MTESGLPKKRGIAPWLIGCGLAILLFVLALGGGAFYLWKTSIVTDPKGVEALADEIVAGAAAPEGYTGVWGMDLFGTRLVVIGPPEMWTEGENLQSTRIVIASSSTGAVPTETMRQTARQDEGEPTKRSDLGTEVVEAKGKRFELRKERSEQDGVQSLGYELDLGTRNGESTKVIFLGPEEGFDRAAMTSFLGGISPPSTTDAKPAAGSEEKPEGASPSPEDRDKDKDKNDGK